MLTTNGSRSFETVPSSEPQTNSTALLALARVAAHHGLSLDVNQISRSHPFTTEEPAAELLLQIIARAGLKGKRMHVKRGDLASVSRLVPFILLYPEGRAAGVRSIQQTAGPSVAVVEQFDVGCEVSALYDEPRLFESWSGDFIAVRMPFLAAGSDPPFGF